MRFPKAIILLSVFWFFNSLSGSLSHSVDELPAPAVQDFVQDQSMERFGPGSKPHFLDTFHSLDRAPAVHLFLITKNGEPLPDNLFDLPGQGRTLHQKGERLSHAGRTDVAWYPMDLGSAMHLQAHRFGTLLVSARPEAPAVIAFHHGLPAYVISKKVAAERADMVSMGRQMVRDGVLYISPFSYYFEFHFEGETILVNPFDLEILSAPDPEAYAPFPLPQIFDTTPQASLSERLQEKNRGSIDLSGASSGSLTISGVPDYNQRPWLTNSCGPTAAACLLGYWDNQGYEAFMDGTETYDDVTRLIDELCNTMRWDPTSGVTYSDIPKGFRPVIDDRGYAFDIASMDGIDSLSIPQEEILRGRPFLYGSQENPWETPHYVVVVGYDENFIIVHDNWESTPTDYYVNWNALGHSDDMMTTLIPEGQESFPNEALPDGSGGGGGGCFVSVILASGAIDDQP